jgi:D-tagatose-1,6-bisphosphate aldolase subunit GatZ/KbaZ
MISVQNKIKEIVLSNKKGYGTGITSVCSANWFVVKAAVKNAVENQNILLIEATSNQVNQSGGYTGYTPARFINKITGYANEAGLPPENIILGGDHLGPNAWQKKNSAEAMELAKIMTTDYISAGFSKIHLDTSMKCADDGDLSLPLEPSVIADRAAQLCRAAEEAYHRSGLKDNLPVYVIGTDVPPPGGSRLNHNDIRITLSAEVEATIDLTKKAFEKYSLHDAWERVIAVVVQPGVEFGDSVIYEYKREKAAELVSKINSISNLVFEAHSTDYQTKEALKQMVEDHFAILKVGPWLTYAFREAVFALAAIEKELLADKKTCRFSGIHDIIDTRMLQNPVYWNDFYSADDENLKIALKYSYSDRIRYYWADEIIAESLSLLISNLKKTEVPDTILSQFMPEEYDAYRSRKISKDPEDLIYHKINNVLEIYNYAAKGVKH